MPVVAGLTDAPAPAARDASKVPDLSLAANLGALPGPAAAAAWFVRSSGILLHLTSLPGSPGIGDLGPSARHFIDFLKAAGQSWWQMLPVGPAGPGHSPYSAASAFAGNVLMISPELLARDGLISKASLASLRPSRARMLVDKLWGHHQERVDFEAVTPARMKLLDEAYETFASTRTSTGSALAAEFTRFKDENAAWLADYALFQALKDVDPSKTWNQWDTPLAKREPEALARARTEHADAIDKHSFQQFLFARQWKELGDYSRQQGVKLIGDIPFFVAYDSCDVWSHPELFKLDDHGKPTVVSGVPPDSFSAKGQLWGTPVYNWENCRGTNFQWWSDRLGHLFKLFDVVRIDHFRGFQACWETPASEVTAERGHWVETPGEELFKALEKAHGKLPVIAEDLGVITPQVEKLRDDVGFPGMGVLQFGLEETDPTNPHKLENYLPFKVIYTGTHDNDTMRGWFKEASAESKQRCARTLELQGGQRRQSREVSWAAIRACLASAGGIVIAPLQDVLGQGGESRMNKPGDAGDVWWRYRVPPGALSDSVAARLRGENERSGRLPTGSAAKA
jgi:4-alpha-glucanotransferase